MILMKCPEFPEKNLSKLGIAMGKSSGGFRKVLFKLNHLIRGGKEPIPPGIWYQSTNISEELLLHGFGPFDFKNRSYMKNVGRMASPQESRKNLKELIVWLCKTFKSPESVKEGFDPLRGREPFFYGLSVKDGKCTFLV